MQKISFEKKDVDLNLICVTLYIKKGDIKAVKKGKAEDAKPVKTPSAKQESEPVVSSAPAPKAASSSEVFALKIDAPTAKENEILAELVKFKQYAEHKGILSKKSSQGDVKTGLTKDISAVSDCYWIIYDENRQMLALLDKSKNKNMLTGENVNLSEYAKYGKLWILIYND